MPQAAEADEEVIVDEACGFQVTATEMKVVQGYALQPESLPFIQNANLLPYRGRGKWKHDIMERACDFGGDCGMAYFCPLFPLAQIAERIRFVIGNVFGIENDGDGYTRVLIGGVVWIVIDILITCITGSSSVIPALTIFCAMISCQMRGIIRALHGIPGSKTDDCCLSFFCQPCAIMRKTRAINLFHKAACMLTFTLLATPAPLLHEHKTPTNSKTKTKTNKTHSEMVGTLWTEPKQVPGCSFDKAPAFEV